MSQIIGIIPVRWGSTRFPGKPLALIAGKPLVQWVWERARAAKRLAKVIVATDDARIAEAAEAFGARVAMTSALHQSGTDRVAEAARLCAADDVSQIINIQGDEPAISPALIDRLADALLNGGVSMVTAACPIRDVADLGNPNCVKVVLGRNGDALYFSRSPIPYARGGLPPSGATFYRHQGIYGYERGFLERFVSWAPSPLELAERLEQLRALENGGRIRVLISEGDSPGVDTPEDVARAEAALAVAGVFDPRGS